MLQPSESVWLQDLDPISSKKLPNETIVLIVGAGMTGCSAAYHLSTHGVSSVMVDARSIAGGASGRNGGILHPTNDFECRTALALEEFIEKQMGLDAASFRRGSGAVLVSDMSNSNINSNLKLNSLRGNTSKEYSEFDPVSNLHAAPGVFSKAYMHNNVSSFWPAKVCCALAEAANKCTVVENCRVLRWTRKISSDISSNTVRFEVETSHGIIVCEKILLATNAWSSQLVPRLKPYLTAVTNTVLASKKPVPSHLVWDDFVSCSCGEGAEEVYMTIRSDGRIILGGFRAFQEDYGINDDTTDAGRGDIKAKEALIDWFKSSFPALADTISIESGDKEDDNWGYEWKGLICITSDGKPVAGSVEHGVDVLGGYNGHGMPQCFGLAKAWVQSFLEHEIDEIEYWNLCSVARFIGKLEVEK
jgi:gamma-glutamylputrescine oxidase